MLGFLRNVRAGIWSFLATLSQYAGSPEPVLISQATSPKEKEPDSEALGLYEGPKHEAPHVFVDIGPRFLNQVPTLGYLQCNQMLVATMHDFRRTTVVVGWDTLLSGMVSFGMARLVQTSSQHVAILVTITA